jgi:hypothetical protein
MMRNTQQGTTVKIQTAAPHGLHELVEDAVWVAVVTTRGVDPVRATSLTRHVLVLEAAG